MPTFSQESRSKLITCHQDLQVIFFEVIKHFDCTIIEGHRGKEAQDKAFAEGKSKLTWPNGKHNQFPSMAIDVAPCPIDWKDKSRMYWFAGFVLGISMALKDQGKISHSLRYGGDWNKNYDINDETFFDLVHFELV